MIHTKAHREQSKAAARETLAKLQARFAALRASGQEPDTGDQQDAEVLYLLAYGDPGAGDEPAKDADR